MRAVTVPSAQLDMAGGPLGRAREGSAGSPRATEAERIVALGRVVLAGYLVVAVAVDSDISHRVVTLSVALAYAVYALVWNLAAHRAVATNRDAQLFRHVADLFVLSGLILLAESTSTPLVYGFVFSVACAALVFDTAAVRATAVATVMLYVLLAAGSAMLVGTHPFVLDKFVIRLGFLTVISVLLLQLKVHEERLRRDYGKLAGWPRAVPSTLEPMLEAMLTHTADIFTVPRVVLIWEDDSPNLHLAIWTPGGVDVLHEPLKDFEPVVDRALHIRSFIARNRPGRALAHTDEAVVTSLGSNPLRDSFRDRFQIDTVAGAGFAGDTVAGWVFALDRPDFTTDDLLLAEVVAEFIEARLAQFRVTEGARGNAVAEERLRMARDLHDGILQSLSGTAFHLQLLRELTKRDPSAALFTFDEVEQALIDDQREVRAFIAGLRSALPQDEEIRFTPRLVALGDRIEREWGLKVTMHISPLVEIISPGMAEEVYRIVKEALTNAATHSRASRIIVEVAVRSNRTHILVEDNGRGFSFAGRFDLTTLTAHKRGPLTLKERVAAVGGNLIIDSSADGARLEIDVPLTLAGVTS